jgi:exopolyphosphatase/guanosine-5'-triphosphate,3'-diphosphate pyrophosphatase
MTAKAMRVAGIDCGTNSIRLLIADAGATGSGLADVVREMRIVRLGQDVDRTGRLAPEALERTRVALAEYATTIKQHGVERVRMTATSATRDAQNRDEFVTMVQAELGVGPEVITGTEEAALSFAGAVAGLPGARSPLLVADIGGGSTELVLGGNGLPGLRSHSMDVGCVRMTERHLRDDPPTPAQIAATVADLNAAINRAAVDVPLDSAATFVGVAGTVTTIAAIALDLPEYDADAIHGSTISAAQVAEVTARLLRMSHGERAALPVMHPGRVDVIGGGALVLRTLMERTGAPEVVASEHDILDGIALSLLR